MKTLLVIFVVVGVALLHSTAKAGGGLGNFLQNYGNAMQGADAAERERQLRESSGRNEIGNWQSATNVNREPTGDPMLTRCIYRTIGGYEFSINARGLCPYMVQINPETNQVRR